VLGHKWQTNPERHVLRSRKQFKFYQPYLLNGWLSQMLSTSLDGPCGNLVTVSVTSLSHWPSTSVYNTVGLSRAALRLVRTRVLRQMRAPYRPAYNSHQLRAPKTVGPGAAAPPLMQHWAWGTAPHGSVSGDLLTKVDKIKISWIGIYLLKKVTQDSVLFKHNKIQ